MPYSLVVATNSRETGISLAFPPQSGAFCYSPSSSSSLAKSCWMTTFADPSALAREVTPRAGFVRFLPYRGIRDFPDGSCGYSSIAHAAVGSMDCSRRATGSTARMCKAFARILVLFVCARCSEEIFATLSRMAELQEQSQGAARKIWRTPKPFTESPRKL